MTRGGLLTEEQFSRILSVRARKERPDLRIRILGKSFLLVEPPHGGRRLVPLSDLYQLYCTIPLERDELISQFLASLFDDEPARIVGGFLDNRSKILPQVVPPSLLDFCRRENRDLVSVDYVGDLSIAFVLDEADRYAYLHRSLMQRWGTNETELLRAAVQNLEALNRGVPSFHQIGKGQRLTLAWETFDGYDASRILLTSRLNEVAAMVPGNPVIAIPHRDYMVMFGDALPAFVAEMGEKVYEAFQSHGYPISPQLFTLREGNLILYSDGNQRTRLLN